MALVGFVTRNGTAWVNPDLVAVVAPVAAAEPGCDLMLASGAVQSLAEGADEAARRLAGRSLVTAEPDGAGGWRVLTDGPSVSHMADGDALLVRITMRDGVPVVTHTEAYSTREEF